MYPVYLCAFLLLFMYWVQCIVKSTDRDSPIADLQIANKGVTKMFSLDRTKAVDLRKPDGKKSPLRHQPTKA